MSSQGCFRNIFRAIEDPDEWQDAVQDFPNLVPRFDSVEECKSFIRKYSGSNSNPDYPGLTHSITTLVSWEQIQKYLLPKLREYNRLPPIGIEDVNVVDNRFVPATDSDSNGKSDSYSDVSSEPVRQYVLSRLQLPVHRFLTDHSTLNTLHYLFHHMRCGILVSIRQNEVVVFCPFVNKDYTNTWADKLEVEGGSVNAYFSAKSRYYRPENVIDKSQWWANGNIICCEHTQPGVEHTQYWGDHFLLQLKDMIAETCANREIPDCDFFINKRDYPQLKFNADRQVPVEPYGFIFNKDDRNPDEDVPLAEHEYATYAPILCTIPAFRGLGGRHRTDLPPSMSWKPTDQMKDFPKIRDLFTATNLQKFEKPWEDKRNVAFFRGSATGGGVTCETNQRLNVSRLCHLWEQEGSPYKGYLDAGVVKWNLRDKKIAGDKMTFLKKDSFDFGLANFTPIYEQSSFKYLLYIEGHCAACRYGFMMCLGSVILKVDSLCVADEMWYFPLLRPYVDHVPVKSDLSDLAEVIEWCRANDDKCREIAANAKKLHDEYISREGILDYMQMVLLEIAKRRVVPMECFRNPSEPLPVLADSDCANRQSCCEANGFPALCLTCRIRKEVNEKKRKNENVVKRADMQHKKSRERMKRMKERQNAKE